MILGLFDFNSYYGDTTSNSWISKVMPVVIGAFLGFSLTKLSDYIKGRKSIRSAGTDLINEVSLLKSPIQKQAESLNKLVTQLKVDAFNAPTLELNFLLNTKRIELIDRSLAMEYFVKTYEGNRKNAREKLNNIFSGLDIIAYESKRIEQLFNYYLEQGTIYFKEWKTSADKIITYCANCTTDLERQGKPIESDAFVHSFFLLTNTFAQAENQELFFLRDNFHTPLARLDADHRIDPRVSQLREYNYQCFQAIKELSALREECALKFGRISKSLESQYSKLETDIKLN
ncbi:MAG: hypothetical protein ABI763_05365 [Bacteroidota bacterium]